VKPAGQIQGRLLSLAFLFTLFFAAALTLSPAARERSWQVDYRFAHWLGLLAWAGIFLVAHRETSRRTPDIDPYLLPTAALLSGWGMLTVWRLYPDFGLRQTLWLLISVGVFILGLRLPSDLSFLRRYKYVWLTSGLALTGLTLVLGVNPMGSGPRMWLGCCGVYLQPSEPLKLLLIVYLAAYLSGGRRDHQGQLSLPPALASGSLIPLLAPTLIMTSLALLLLLIQRDLGTASIFIFLYAAILYVATGRKQILVAQAVMLVIAGAAGYLLFDVVRLRIDAWLNPWLDPSGRSFQIVQSLLAIANGGLLGRGPGLGSPGLVPVPHSDFIYSSLVEETGLMGGVGLLALYALLANRGIRIALRASDNFRRYLAAGLTAFLVAQAVLIIGGNLRLLPLTGVTLPLVSYGGSSLLTAYISLLFLAHASSTGESRPAPLPRPAPYLQLGAFLMLGIAAAALLTGWWTVVRSPDLLTRTDNPRRAIGDRYVRRGAILDRSNEAIAATTGEPGSYTRRIFYPALSSVVGYTHPVYGQAALEVELDPYLRGLEGNPDLTIWVNYLLYGQPPPGLNVRLTIDLDLQIRADELLEQNAGAAVLLNAANGEVLAMASHPTFNANELDSDWQNLLQDPHAPLINRAIQGQYAPGAALAAPLLARLMAEKSIPPFPEALDYRTGEQQFSCALPPDSESWGQALSGGCPGALAALAASLGAGPVQELFDSLGIFDLPAGAADPGQPPFDPAASGAEELALGVPLRVSPLQVAQAAAALSGGGDFRSASLVSAVNTPGAGWVPLADEGEAAPVLDENAARRAAGLLADETGEIWRILSVAPSGEDRQVTWFVGGTIPGRWEGAPLTAVVVLETEDPALAQEIGLGLLHSAMQPEE